MIKHIVMWKLEDKDKKENCKKIKESLEALKNVVPELKFIEVGININEAESYDVVLNSEFESMEGLQAYQVNPNHVKAAGFIKSVAISRTAVDYEF